MKKVSIIIPCYNQAEFLPYTLKCLCEQTLGDFECIVVDDGSTDDSANIAEEFSKRDSRFVVVRKKNGGTATARNEGLRHATGEYIQFLDADDEIAKDKLLLQTEFMDSKGLDVSFTDFLHFKEDTNNERTFVPHSKVKSRDLLGLHFSMLTRWGVDFSLPPCAFLYKREFLDKNNLRFSESIRYREDWDFHISVSNVHPKIARMDGYVGAFYRMNMKGKTSSAEKITKGNIGYMVYKCRLLGVIDFILLAYRLSCEVLLLVGRCTKYRKFSPLKLLSALFSGIKPIVLFLVAILLLPLAVLHVCVRTIYEYTL